MGLLVFIIILCAAIQMRNDQFLTVGNLQNLFTNTAILGILSVGMMLVLLSGGIDLSIGSTVAFSGMVVAITVRDFPAIHPIFLLFQGALIGAALGAITGILVARFSILPIIASLGMMNIVRGATFWVSDGAWVSAHQMPDRFISMATARLIPGVSNLIVIAVIVYIVFWYFINHTKTGRRIYAVGSNPTVAEISGLPVKRTIALVYVLMGFLAGLAGVLWVSMFASAQGDTATGFELSVIAACVLGGISVAGGRGRIGGLVLGVVLFGILANALPLLLVSPFWQQAIQGFVILAAIITNVIIKRRNDRKILLNRVI